MLLIFRRSLYCALFKRNSISVVELRGGPRGPAPWKTGRPPRNTWFERVQGGLWEGPPEITRQIQYMIATYQYQYQYKLTNRNKTIESWLVEKLGLFYVTVCIWIRPTKLRLSSLDVIISPRSWRRRRSTYPWSFRSGNSGCKTWFSLYRTRLKNHRQRLPQGSPHCAPASSIHTPV